jgi:Zn-dependent protease with chaperone function
MTAGYVAHGVTLALAWFVLANALASLTVALAARRLVLDRRPRTAGWWLALRCLPAAAALAFVGVVFVPSYVRFEPREAIEGFDMTLTVCAAAALGVVSIAAVRGGRSWRRASHQAAVWMRGARPLSPAAAGVPAYTIGSAPMPLMALAGIVSPRVFVSERLVDGLSPDELAATLAHEAAHARSGDNFKRLVIRLLPDGLAGTRTAAAIEQRWASAAEHEADRTATAGNPAARCALASALVKVARLMPPAAAPLDPISTLVGGGDLASRVESLLDEPMVVRSSRAALWGAAAALACSAFAYAPLLRAVHEITEILVNSLP